MQVGHQAGGLQQAAVFGRREVQSVDCTVNLAGVPTQRPEYDDKDRKLL